MNQDILLEVIEIIGKHLLYDPKFGGTPESRRLAELLRQLGRLHYEPLPPTGDIPPLIGQKP